MHNPPYPRREGVRSYALLNLCIMSGCIMSKSTVVISIRVVLDSARIPGHTCVTLHVYRLHRLSANCSRSRNTAPSSEARDSRANVHLRVVRRMRLQCRLQSARLRQSRSSRKQRVGVPTLSSILPDPRTMPSSSPTPCTRLSNRSPQSLEPIVQISHC